MIMPMTNKGVNRLQPLKISLFANIQDCCHDDNNNVTSDFEDMEMSPIAFLLRLSLSSRQRFECF